MIEKNNIKYILLDIWGTLLFDNENEKNINLERATIINKITNYKNIRYWKNEIEQEIIKFKQKELLGFSIKPKERIQNILSINNINIEKSEEILYEYDKLIIDKYKPSLNTKLLNKLLNKKNDILLISNTGLTTKNAVIEILKEYNILDNFKDMFFSEDYDYCKPNPLFYMVPLNKYKINKEELVMYGDSIIMDLEPCNKLGINSVVKRWENYN